jgi:hypothetical protein
MKVTEAGVHADEGLEGNAQLEGHVAEAAPVSHGVHVGAGKRNGEKGEGCEE